MFIVFDLIIVGILALCIFIGYKQGLAKSLIKIAAFLISIIISLVLYKPVSRAIINKTNIDEKINSVIVQNTKININKKANNGTGSLGFIQDTIQSKVVENTEAAIEKVSNNLAIRIIEIMTLLLLFLILRIAIIIITILVDVASKLPVIKQANKLGGIIYGAIKGLLIVYIMLALIYLIAPLISLPIMETIDKSIVTKKMYDNNIVLKILLKSNKINIDI